MKQDITFDTGVFLIEKSGYSLLTWEKAVIKLQSDKYLWLTAH